MLTIQRQLRPDDICVLTFDRPESPANIFDRKTLEELDGHVSAIAEPGLGAKGLILISAKPSIFIAGADLKAIQQMSREELASFIELGQRVFTQLAGLKIPTVAAIHGACVGGGYELALACDWRVASPERSTKIGLPETMLGILPAWGGSIRLPRLIGLPAALDLILGGKTYAAKGALKKGLIDAVAKREALMEAALEHLRKGKRQSPWNRNTLFQKVTGRAVRMKATGMVERKTRGNYPAIPKALDVVVRAAGSKQEEGLRLEREAVMELAGTEAAHNLIRLFFLQERAKKLNVVPEGDAPLIRNTAVIGAGVMGSAIAQWFAARGHRTILRDINPSRVAAGMANAAKLFESAVKRHVFTKNEARRAYERIAPADTEVPLRQVDLVVEAAVEKMEVKKTIFRRLDEQVREDAVLATNTSALSITELAATTQHPGRVVGVHFFNPVHQMQLVEVVIGPETAPLVAQRVVKFIQKLGKLPVLVKDSPGFLVNRILLPYMLEAGTLFEKGANIGDIDEAMLDFGMPMGPLRLIDEVGVDIAEDVARTLSAAFPERMHIPPILTKLLENKLLGRKSGEGFYTHKGKEAVPSNRAVGLRDRRARLTLSRKELSERLSLLMVNEAARCLEEGIVESAADVDFGMVMGTGFAPFRGGPLRYADSLGLPHVVERLTKLASEGGAHCAPAALLSKLAAENRKFHED